MGRAGSGGGRRHGAAAASLVALALAALLQGCEPGRSGSQPTPSGKAESPFTGLMAAPGQVLAAKIDNVGPARPHSGLASADIVYVEQVEAGQSRIMAILSSRLPPKLGPVRSARESDLEILRQFGRPALAYSGAQSKLSPLIESAPLFALPPSKAPRAYFRDSSRPAPHNLYLRPQKLLDRAPDASDPRDIGFRFGAAPGGGKPTANETVRFPAARYTFSWSAQRRNWLVSMDGKAATTTDKGRLTASTVVVQRVTVRDSRFKDKWGSVSPFSETVGSGTAVVLRDGKAYDVRWQRRSAASGTTFTTSDGERMPFAKGPVWVLLAAR